MTDSDTRRAFSVADLGPETASGSCPVLVTGAAGFIGFHLSQRLLAMGATVVGVDNLNDYYDPGLKEARLAILNALPGFRFVKADVADADAVMKLTKEIAPRHFVHLAAQAGVRYSIENPHAYGSANLTGFLNVLEAARAHPPAHLVYASSSSVYGGNTKQPFSVDDSVDHPVSLYAATKKANELMAHSYSHLYGLPATGLRFFTVYGPFGRPDMAYFMFTKAILEGKPIKLFNYGDVARDFTYVDDIVEGVLRVMATPPEPDPDFDRDNPSPGRSWAPHRVYNIGNRGKEPVKALISYIERATNKKAELELLPMQPGDVAETLADVSALEADTGFRPDTPLETGVRRFVDWYRSYYES